MGCTHANKKFVPRHDIPGQDETCNQIFNILGLVESEIDQFYTCFTDIDTHKTGNIRPIEFFTYFGIDMSPFEQSLFAVFDDDNSGKLTFLEFVCAMWNLLSMPVSLLGALMYMMKDRSGVLRIRYADIKEVVELMHKKRVESTPTLQAIFADLKNNYSAELSIQDICKWSLANQSILSPIIILQLKFRKQLLGEKYWQEASENRLSDPEKGSVGFIKDLFQQIRIKTEEVRKERELKQISEKLHNRYENLSASQANIKARQSILMRTFNLSRPQITRQASGKQMSLDANVSGDIKVKTKPSSTPSGDQSPKKNAAASIGAVAPTGPSISPSGGKTKKSKSKKSKDSPNSSPPKDAEETKGDEDYDDMQRQKSTLTATSLSSKRPQSAKQTKKEKSSKHNKANDSPTEPPSRPKSASAKRSNSKRSLAREDSKVSLKSSRGRKSSITT